MILVLAGGAILLAPAVPASQYILLGWDLFRNIGMQGTAACHGVHTSSVHHVLRWHTFTDESRPIGGFISAETLVQKYRR